MFGERVVQAAAKGMLNVDEKQRQKNMVKTARARLRLVKWQFQCDGKTKWIQFDSEASFSLELGRMSGNTTFTIISNKFSNKPIHIDLVKMNAVKNERGERIITKIERQVRSLGLKEKDTWECRHCGKRTSNDNNACIFCGRVKNT